MTEKLQKSEDDLSGFRMKQLDFIDKRTAKRMKQKHTPAMLMKQYMSTMKYLLKK